MVGKYLPPGVSPKSSLVLAIRTCRGGQGLFLRSLDDKSSDVLSSYVSMFQAS